ncbi:MAG: phage holin family protein [Mesonia hippocampi]|uniref:Phage holin family protein n=1 Tax=Mesonia hippocampi TaxID=1628250 RepID=A0A840EN93_9FLAO|nr:competence protein [Mesonia hippocampi]MBB4118440.1 hypothetical protein [Mesonia hippocampi]
MAFNHLNNNFKDLNEHTQNYIESLLAYYKLDIFKKTSQSAAMLVKLLCIGSLFLFFLAFTAFAFAFLIGAALDSYSAGFFIISGVFLLITILIYIFRKQLVDKVILKRFSTLFFDNEEPIENIIKGSITPKE